MQGNAPCLAGIEIEAQPLESVSVRLTLDTRESGFSKRGPLGIRDTQGPPLRTT